MRSGLGAKQPLRRGSTLPSAMNAGHKNQIGNNKAAAGNNKFSANNKVNNSSKTIGSVNVPLAKPAAAASTINEEFNNALSMAGGTTTIIGKNNYRVHGISS